MSIAVNPHALAGIVPSTVRRLCERIHDAGFGVWCVGGAIRDAILKQLDAREEVSLGDWDVASTATPDEVTRLFRRVVPSGIRHGTVTVILPDQSVEVTTLRGEGGYTDGRRPDTVTFVKDIVEDLARRDFTINAIAFDPIQGTLVDPFDGVSDLASKCLRAVGDPQQRFAEDGLRVLRAARFTATLAVHIEEKTQAAMRPSLSSYHRVSAERIRDEWIKALGAPSASRAFRVMLEQGMLEITVPELTRMHHCMQNQHHRHDVWEHTLATLDGVPNDSIQLRLAALFHDVGKPCVRAISPKTGDYTFHNHEVEGARLTDQVLRRLRFPNDARERVVALVLHHLVVYTPSWTDAAVRRWINRVTPELTGDLLALARADVTAKGIEAASQLLSLGALEQRVHNALRSKQALALRDLAITGHQLMEELAIAPGPLVGQLLRSLLEDVLEAPEHNERERLLDRARELLKSSAASTRDGTIPSRGT